MSLASTLADNLAALRAAHLERHLRVISGRCGAVVQTDRGRAVDFSSNDYLGLASDPRLVAAAAAIGPRLGGGATASRLIAGNTDEHDALDAAIAEFFGAEAALSFSSGYAANVGIIPALVGRDDVIFSDELNHASLIDGCRLSRATIHVYPHADTAALIAPAGTPAATARNPLRDPRDRRLPRVPEPCALVVFGVTGDLSRKKLLPAVYDLAHRGLLPPDFVLLGFARQDWGDGDFESLAKAAASEAHSASRPARLLQSASKAGKSRVSPQWLSGMQRSPRTRTAWGSPSIATVANP